MLWACQEVAFISSASVAPFGRFRSSRTFSVLLPFREPDSFLAALAAFALLVAFFGWDGLLTRLTLAGRNTGLPWRGVGRFGGLRLPSRGGLERLFFRIRRRHREFSFCGNHRGQDIHRSGREDKQANSAAHGDGMSMMRLGCQIASGGIR